MPAYKDKDRGTWYASFYYTDWQGAREILGPKAAAITIARIRGGND